MPTFTTIMPNGSAITQEVRGICSFDVLNPCWNNRPTDVAGLHWSSEPDAPVHACYACTKAAFERYGEGD